MVLPEQTEDGAPCGQGNQRQTVAQCVQCLNNNVEAQLQKKKKRLKIIIIINISLIVSALVEKSVESCEALMLKIYFKTILLKCKQQEKLRSTGYYTNTSPTKELIEKAFK